MDVMGGDINVTPVRIMSPVCEKLDSTCCGVGGRALGQGIVHCILQFFAFCNVQLFHVALYNTFRHCNVHIYEQSNVQ